MQKAFNLSFWKGALSGVAACSAIFAAIAVFISANNSPKPSFPIWGHTYLSYYAGGHHLDHYFFRFGLFGFGDRIRTADVLVLGSSHAEFGISAKTIAVALSERRGRAVTAFNMATDAGDGLGFAREVLEANNIQGKTLLLDLYSNEQGLPSPVARKVQQTDILGAYIAVAAIYTEFAKDWFVDGLLPRISYGLGASVRVDRFLGMVIIRHWANGDIDDMWVPQRGSLFWSTQAEVIPRAQMDSFQLKGPSPTLTPEYGAYLRSKDFNVALTLIPYDGYRRDEAKRAAEQIGRPFLEIEPTDLQSGDRAHLNAVSRDIATQRLIDRWPDSSNSQ